MIVVVAGGAELVIAAIEDLWLLQEEHAALDIADPERGIGIDAQPLALSTFGNF